MKRCCRPKTTRPLHRKKGSRQLLWLSPWLGLVGLGFWSGASLSNSLCRFSKNNCSRRRARTRLCIPSPLLSSFPFSLFPFFFFPLPVHCACRRVVTLATKYCCSARHSVFGLERPGLTITRSAPCQSSAQLRRSSRPCSALLVCRGRSALSSAASSELILRFCELTPRWCCIAIFSLAAVRGCQELHSRG